MAIVARDDRVQIESMALGPFGTNAYVLRCLKTGDSVVVDAPGEVERILEGLEGTNPRYILMNTRWVLPVPVYFYLPLWIRQSPISIPLFGAALPCVG